MVRFIRHKLFEYIEQSVFISFLNDMTKLILQKAYLTE